MEETITALLAPIAGGHRYWLRKPQTVEASRYVVLQRAGGLRDYHMQGASGLAESRIQVDCYAETFTAARNLAADARRILSGYRGGSIRGIFMDSERDLPATDAGEATHLFRTSVDFIIQHQET